MVTKLFFFENGSTQTEDMGGVTIVRDLVTDINLVSFYCLRDKIEDNIVINQLCNNTKETDVLIYDATGKLMMRSRSHQINVRELKPGAYLLRVDQHVVKFLKR